MTQEILASRIIQEGDFAALIQDYTAQVGEPVFVWLESMPRQIVKPQERQDLLRLDLYRPDLDLHNYTGGRIFHRQGEIRWERQDTMIHLVYTGYAEYQPSWPGLPASQPLDLTPYRRIRSTYFLFGKRLEQDQVDRLQPLAQRGDFAEVRIPRLLRYPDLPELAEAERLQFSTYTYLESSTGICQAYRFNGLLPIKKSVEGPGA